MPDKEPTLTTNFGVPVADNQNSLTAGNPGPTLIADHYMLEKNAHFNRERVPERVVHAKGGGAFGLNHLSNRLSCQATCKVVAMAVCDARSR